MYDFIPSVSYRAYVQSTKNNPTLDRFVKYQSMDFEQRIFFLYNDDVKSDMLGEFKPLIYVPGDNLDQKFFYSIIDYEYSNPTYGFVNDHCPRNFTYSEVMEQFGIDSRHHSSQSLHDILTKIRFLFGI